MSLLDKLAEYLVTPQLKVVVEVRLRKRCEALHVSVEKLHEAATTTVFSREQILSEIEARMCQLRLVGLTVEEAGKALQAYCKFGYLIDIEKLKNKQHGK